MIDPDPDRSWDTDITDRIDVREGADTDGDGRADTVVLAGDDDLVIAADLDRDGLADLIIEIGPTMGVSTTLLPGQPPGAESWIGSTLDSNTDSAEAAGL